MKPVYVSLLRNLLASLCALTAALAFTPASASALLYTGISFGPTGTSESAFQQASAVGVDQSAGGPIYVEDAAADTVQKFNANREPEAFMGPNLIDPVQEGKLTGFSFVRPGFPYEPLSQIAVDSAPASPSFHDFYVVNVGTETVRAFEADGQPADFSEGAAKGTSELGGFEGNIPCGVAVDGNGDVYVGVYGSGVDVYAPGGEPLATISTSFACNLAVDSKGAVYVDYFPGSFSEGVRKFTPSEFPVTKSTTYTEASIVDANSGWGVAVDPATNELYVDEHTRIARYEEDGTLLETFPATGGAGAPVASEGLAWDAAAGGVFVSDAQGARQVALFGPKVLVPRVAIEPVSGVSETAVTLHGSVTPEENKVTKCFFEYGETTGYGQSAPCEQAPGSISETGTTKVSVTLSGLPPAKVRHFRLVAASESGEGRSDDLAIERPAVPSESVSHVTNDSATLEGEVDPRGMDTTYEFSYGPTSACGGGECSVPVPAADIGAGTIPVPVSYPIHGLQAGAVYHYRIVARNALGAENGAEQTFTTSATGEFKLPDNRQWQMVSPAEKQGALFDPIREHEVVQAAADGHAITYQAIIPTEADPTGYDNNVQVLSARVPGGWQTRDLTVPHQMLTEFAVGQSLEYPFFSQDLSRAAVQPFGPFVPCRNAKGEPQACISEAASGQTPFLENTAAGVFTPLLASCPVSEACPKAVEEAADEPPGSITYNPEEHCTLYCAEAVGGGTPDLQHVILGTSEWSADGHGQERLQPWALLPPDAEGKVLPAENAELGFSPGELTYNHRDAISSNGERVVFEAERDAHLYMRVNATEAASATAPGEGCTEPAKACTIQLDSGLTGEPVFQIASSSGSRVYFSENGDLYVYELKAEHPGPVRVTKEAGILGPVIGASEDGSYVYVIGSGVLAAGGVAGQPNLYVLHNSGQAWEAPRLVAVLSNADEPDWADRRANLNNLTGRVSPDGRWVAFMSQRSLTGYDNRDAVSGEPDEEVYLYHAPEELASQAGVLVCGSCNPTGERPHGTEYGIEGSEANAAMPLEGGDRVWPGASWIAANVPGWTPFELEKAAYQSRYLSDSGRLFFNSRDALVPEDTNGTGDVYEYEPQGVGPAGAQCGPGASDGSEVFEQAREVSPGVVQPAGCVALVSSGTSTQESAFLDASETGGDVFFLTSSKLVSKDYDNALDVYDAHECTGESPCLPPEPASPPACDTEASCKPAPSPQPLIYGAPASATFNGPGNPPPPSAPASPKPKSAGEVRAEKLARALKQCRKDRSKKKRASCEQAARRAYGAAKRARKSGNGRTGR